MAVMGGSEAMVEALRNEGVTIVMGVVGSAFMDALDIFPQAGIRFLPVRHEQAAAHMADGYARVTGRPGVCTGQNGPGITNMVTGIAAAYLAHSPVILITPGVTSASVGTDGFQEADQMKIFAAITKYQVQVNRADRFPECFRNAYRVALAELGPVQVDVPRDYLYQEVDVQIIPPERYRVSKRGAGDPSALGAAADLLANAAHPVIMAGLGVVYADAVQDVAALAEYLSAPVVTSYLHNDAFPANHSLAAGPIGYGGSKAAMRLISRADVVLALGSRLSIFGTLAQYGFDYWPKDAKLIQVDINPRQIGRVKPFDVGIIGDAKLAAAEILQRIRALRPGRKPDTARVDAVGQEKQAWAAELQKLSSSDRTPISPRRALRELVAALPDGTVVTTDIGNICSLANAYLQFNHPRTFLPALSFGNCGFSYPAALGAKLGRPDAPVVALVGDGAWGMSLNEVLTAVQEHIPVVAVVMNNNQWGAEKKNQVDYYGNRFIGTNIMPIDYAAIARAMGAEAHRVERPDQIGDAVRAALRSNRPAVVEVVVNSEELFDPFRRDALRAPKRHLPRYQEAAATPARV
jgi:sulfoacetaldehyde acetyltransferase